MRKTIWLLSILCIPVLCQAQRDAFETLIDQTLQQEELVGASYSMVKDGQILTGAAGLKNAATGEQLTVDHQVQIGSITKTLIATGILRLATQGSIDLEAAVEDLVPSISFDNPWRTSDRVTVRHLLNHTAGLEDASFWQVFSEEAAVTTPLMEVFSRDEEVLRVRTRPGSRFSYSNMGFTLLGLIIEQVTRQPYESYLDQHLLAPLSMKNSTFQFVSQDQEPNLAMGHFDGGITQTSVPMYLRPAGQFTTTAGDMARFAQFLLGDGTINEQPFIEAALLKAMGQPTTTEANQQGLMRGYQYGLSYRDRYGVVGRYHAGNVIGYRATFYLFPEESKAFFISFNTDSETANYEKFNALFATHLEVNHPTPLKAPETSTTALKELTGYYQLAPVRFELFAYLDLLFNSISINYNKDKQQLQVSSLQQSSCSLIPTGTHLFRKEDRVDTSHLFYQTGGKTVYTDALSTYESVSPAYLGLMWLSLILGLLALAFIILRGIFLIFTTGKAWIKHPNTLPFLSILSLAIPIPFFFLQSFNQLGDLTPANLLLTIFTGLLPLALLYGILKAIKTGRRWWNVNSITIALLLQWILVLAIWGLIPMKIWEI